MSEEKLDQMDEAESLPLTPGELLAHAVQDIAAGDSAEFVADEFFEEFVDKKRPEAYQILTMLEMQDELIIQQLVDVQLQSIEIFKANAPGYLNDLRKIVESRIKKMTGK